MLDRYGQIIKLSYIKTIAFRSEVLLWVLLDTFPLLILVFVWQSVYRNQLELAGYTLAAIIQYYFLATVINGLTGSHFEAWRVREIREGKIDFFLTRPLSYLQELLLRDIGGKLFYSSFSLPIFVSVYFLLNQLLQLSIGGVTLLNLAIFLVLLLGAYLIEYLIAALIVMAGFWFEYSEGLEHFKWIVVTIFSGWMIPLAMMPPWLRQIVMALPFRHMYATPIGVILGNYQLQLIDIIYVGGFIVFLYGCLRWVWNRAKYQYGSHGG